MGRNRRFDDDVRDDVIDDDDVLDSENCVCDVVREIADIQDQVDNERCRVSCVRSINDLISPTGRNNFNTVPFILYGKDLKPFKGFGATLEMNEADPQFLCTESFIFRVKEVSDDEDDCCAVLELLTTEPVEPGEDLEEVEGLKTPCEQLDGEPVSDVSSTGICITVDLKCFCAITCLPPVFVR